MLGIPWCSIIEMHNGHCVYCPYCQGKEINRIGPIPVSFFCYVTMFFKSKRFSNGNEINWYECYYGLCSGGFITQYFSLSSVWICKRTLIICKWAQRKLLSISVNCCCRNIKLSRLFFFESTFTYTILSLFTTMLFQTCMIFFVLLNTKGKALENIWLL